MTHRLLLASAAAACALFATQAYAGSPYYGVDGAPAASAVSAAAAGSSAEYRAIGPDEGAATRTHIERRGQPSAGAEVVLGPDGHLPVQQDSVAFRHASGIEGAP